MPSSYNNSNFGTTPSQPRGQRVNYNGKIYSCSTSTFSEFGCSEITEDNKNLNQIAVARGTGRGVTGMSMGRGNQRRGPRTSSAPPSRRRRVGRAGRRPAPPRAAGRGGRMTTNSAVGRRRRRPMPPHPGPGNGGRRPARNQYR